MRNYVYDKAGGKGSILNTKVTTKGLVKTIGGAIIGTAIVANLVGCGALKNYGKLTPDGIYNTDQGIEKKVDLNYFEAGTSKDSPDAIMGLVKSEKLSDDSSWHSLGSYNKTFEESIKDLSDKTSETQESIRKYDLIGPEGRDVGDLYFNGINSGILIKRKKMEHFIFLHQALMSPVVAVQAEALAVVALAVVALAVVLAAANNFLFFTDDS